ncbi:uncharacterized protein LOC62_05G006835 [Vanrija pseudolonga]|uniref:Uncharacterized protein n=1 Tax=Vanrija pseudolonga TaxID=143232 RepID=A0AAF1BJD3_9TREE|nr:hypothetical protein LOC62_05G006835 [Vanrija pseudolonga]
MTEHVKTTIKVLDYVHLAVATGKKTPGPIPHSAHTESEYAGGGVEGTAVSSFSMAQQAAGAKPEDGHFAGIALFEGTILGKKGTVAWTVTGTYIGHTVDAHLHLLSDTATGELKGIHGKGHYKLPPPPEGCDGTIPTDKTKIPALEATFDVGFA